MIGTLFVGKDKESKEAEHAVGVSGMKVHIVECTHTTCDFTPPLLISSDGVFEGLKLIKWYTQVGEGRKRMT